MTQKDILQLESSDMRQAYPPLRGDRERGEKRRTAFYP